MSSDDITLRMRVEQLREFLSGTKQAEQAIKGVRDAQGKLRDAQGRFVSEGGRAAKATDGMARSFRGLQTSLGGVSKIMGVLGGATLGATTMGIASYAVKSAASLEQVTMSYETMLKSQAAATKLVADLRTFARDTPFEFSDVTTAGRTLLAFGAQAGQVEKILTTLGNASAGLGMGGDGLNRLSVIFGQIASKGRLQGDEALQLAEAGISVYDILAKQLDMTPAQVRDLGEKGKLASSQVIPLILKGMEGQFGGLMEKQSKSLGGSWSNLKDTATQALTDAVMPHLPELTALVATATAKIPALADDIGTVVGGMFAAGRATGRFLSRLKDLSETPGAVRLINDIGDGLFWVRDTLGAVLSPIGSLVGYLQNTGNTGEISDALDSIAAFCENPAVQATLKGIAIYAAAMWSFNAATRATAAGMGILKGAMGFFALPGAAGAAGAGVGAAGAGAAAGRFAGLSPFGRILTAAGVGGYYLSKKTGGKFDEDVSRFGQQWSEADGFWGHLAVVPKWVGQTTWAAITDGWGDKFNAILHPSQKLHDAWRGFLDWFMDGLRGVNDWFVDQINRTFSVTIPGTDITIGPNLPHAKPPGAARGGTVLESGLLEVGEAGRETLALPRGASVYPKHRAAEAVAAAGGDGYHEHPIIVDGEVLTRVTHRHTNRGVARR